MSDHYEMKISELEEEIKKLNNELAFLDFLESYGVDNWEGYGEAFAEYKKWLTNADL